MHDTRVLGAPLEVQTVPTRDPVFPLSECNPPGIRLWLVAQHVDLHARCLELLHADHAPFWAFCWAGGQALARFVHAHPEWVRGKHVVDFGAGSGIAGIAAAQAGARLVTAVDVDPDARAACACNAALNGVVVRTQSGLPQRCDVVLAADVLYDDPDGKLLAALRALEVPVLIADPGRPSSPSLSQSPLASYELTTLPDVDPPMRRASVYVL